jgi:ketosteroid isomerase-like protein
MQAEIQRLLDESAVHAVVCRYARAVDRRDWEAVRSCYHPDARDHRGRFDGGVDELLRWLALAVADIEAMTHLITTHTVAVSGDVAASEAYCLARHRLSGGDRMIICLYRDRLERRAGKWRIADRVVVYEPAVDFRADL